MINLKRILTGITRANERYEDYIYATQLIHLIPQLNRHLGSDDLVALQEIDLNDKIANSQKFKRYRSQISRIYVDIARNSIKLSHTDVARIFTKAIDISPMDDRTALQDFIIYEFNHGLENDFLKKLIEHYFERFEKWRNESKNKLIHCINICLKIQENNIKSALNWLNGYKKEFGIDGLQVIPRVAYFAYNNGLQSELIEKSSYIAGEVLRTQQDELFARYLKGKSIAIVGNGPQNIGTKLGANIDNSDIVIRFNNGADTQRFKQDYGSKLTVWVRNNAEPFNNYKSLKKSKFCILIDSIERMHWKDEQILKCYEQLINTSCRLIAPRREFLQEIFKKYDFSRFTSGLLAIAYIIHTAKNANINLYGFSSLDQKLKEDTSFYSQNKLSFYSNKPSNLEPGFMNHCFSKEKQLMTDIISKIRDSNEYNKHQ